MFLCVDSCSGFVNRQIQSNYRIAACSIGQRVSWSIGAFRVSFTINPSVRIAMFLCVDSCSRLVYRSRYCNRCSLAATRIAGNNGVGCGSAECRCGKRASRSHSGTVAFPSVGLSLNWVANDESSGCARTDAYVIYLRSHQSW